MKIRSLLIANRGEVAIRVARAAADMGIRTVAVYSEDDANSLHVRAADHVVDLEARGAAAYLDIEKIISVAIANDCDAIHPGYGFLSENAEFAKRCAEEGLIFVGPQPHVLELMGDKVKARRLAQDADVPVSPGTSHASSLEEVREFFLSLESDTPAIMIKAVAGGGGRGIRTVESADAVEDAYIRCQSEALAAFGNGEVYAEEYLRQARHIEVQIVGDGAGNAVHLWERECSLQRRNQKLIEIAPSPALAPGLIARITGAAVRLAQKVRYKGIGTFEFLVDATDNSETSTFIFMEANPRLQVEHTVTEEVTGIDLVKTQLRIASGAGLDEIGLRQDRIARPTGYAIQLRINMEVMNEDGSARPSGGTLKHFDLPSGPGVRVDTFGYTGYRTNPNFDSLLAKLIVSCPDCAFPQALRRAYRASCEFRIEGVPTNLAFLQNLLRRPEVASGHIDTHFVAAHVRELLAADPADQHPRLHAVSSGHQSGDSAAQGRRLDAVRLPDGVMEIGAPTQGTVVAIKVDEGQTVQRGEEIAVIEAMKMQHAILAETGGTITACLAGVGDTLILNDPIFHIERVAAEDDDCRRAASVALDDIPASLSALWERQHATLDEARPDAVRGRHKKGQRTARENVADLCDPDTFIEYGSLALPKKRGHGSTADLIRTCPADGMVTGIGNVNGASFENSDTRCVVLAYDYTVFAGTQSRMNHKKTDRLVHLAEQWRLPIVTFAEGGGGRPSDVDQEGSMLSALTFANFAKLSGAVPRIGIASGYCFAGNAALLGCCDVVIATENASIGMGGPAMIEGGGLGRFRPENVGPVAVQASNGVIDVVVRDESEAVDVAKKYLGYFQGDSKDWTHVDQRVLRHLVPQDRLRAYDMRSVIDAVADTDSVLELRRSFGTGIITALIRIEGRPLGLIANNPLHLGGAIDADAADKSSRFMRLCEAFGLPLISLCDTPGFMVGPDSERTAMVRHVSRMFVTSASLTIPVFTVFVRKGYGLGAMAMAGGATHASVFSIGWPTAEFGAMGIEGAVKLGYRKKLENIADEDQRKVEFNRMVAHSYEMGHAINIASYFEIDNVIDPAKTRYWLTHGLEATSFGRKSGQQAATGKFLDTW
ncbi:carboxyl transferase domain-containing protein [Paracoccus jeotgali]|uniref:acetyl-CoA carboxylase n=1 Tax=Paracoccus jeotgali TaxID=2065379 RepID=A0A2K9MJE4_9RHOB|nr:carboxyl transferase domain-containing protein [Paracoccus jeotgali]AUM75750.1 carbamoyl-phosphate synthase large subunit [Paracoccus jeotgali]